MATHYIPIQDRSQLVSGPTSLVAIAGISASAVACAGICLSAALHILGGLSAAPVLAGAFVSNRFLLAFWNIGMPCSMLGITLFTYRSWRKREPGNR